MDLPKQLPGLFHTGSVGIIMSGWLGAINYGVIVAYEVESFMLGEDRAADFCPRERGMTETERVLS
jgi:hypothetical protein